MDVESSDNGQGAEFSSDPSFDQSVVTDEIEATPSYLVWGLEAKWLGRGLIPFASLDATQIEFDEFLVKLQYSSDEDQFTFSGRIDFVNGGDSVRTDDTDRTMFKCSCRLWATPRVSKVGGVTIIRYGELFDPTESPPRLVYVPTLYFADDLSAIQDLVEISDSVPLWDWDRMTRPPRSPPADAGR